MRPAVVLLVVSLSAAPSRAEPSTEPETAPIITVPGFSAGTLLASDDFDSPIASRWSIELENGGTVAANDDRLDINVPAGATVWWKPKLTGPVLIQYTTKVIKADGPNDRVSDLNCFWMAHDPLHADLLAFPRSGKFTDYNTLLSYYVGVGGNGNTTTRFRRYIGDPKVRPLLPEHDLHGPGDFLTPNTQQTLDLVAAGQLIEFYRDGKRVFHFVDAHPYESGWFAFRTTKNHMRVSHFRVWQLVSTPMTQP